MNFGQSAKAVLSAVAPVLGTALGGPLGGLAGTLLSNALGTTDPKTMQTAITSGDPAVLLKLQQADKDLQEHMRALDISEEKLSYDDIANARAREVSLRDHIPAILALVVSLGFFGTLVFMCLHGTPTTGGEPFLVMLGSLATAWTGIISYYFGSSAGSAAKTDAINKIVTAKNGGH